MTRGWLVWPNPPYKPICQATLPGNRLAWLWAHEKLAHDNSEYSGNYWKPTHNEASVLVKTKTKGMV